jgi:hypothetical protein
VTPSKEGPSTGTTGTRTGATTDNDNDIDTNNDINTNPGAAPGATPTDHAGVHTQVSTKDRLVKEAFVPLGEAYHKERAVARRAAAAAKESFKAAADAQAALAHAHKRPSKWHVWVLRPSRHGMKGVWRDPDQIDFYDPADYDRAAVKAYHDALPQWLRRRMQMRATTARVPTESKRVWRLETLQWLELRLHAGALRPVRRRRRLRHVPLDVLAMPRKRGADAADTWVDADEDVVYIKDICLFGACDGFHPYLRFQNPHCPCGPPTRLLRPFAASLDPIPPHPVPDPDPDPPGPDSDSDSDSDRWFKPETERFSEDY